MNDPIQESKPVFPPEVEEAIDKRSSMGVIGNLQNYMQFQTATAIGDAAKNPSGTAGEGIGLGMGFAMAQQMAGMYQQRQAGAPGGPGVPPPIIDVQFYVVLNGQQAGPYDNATMQQLVRQQMVKPDSLVWKQGMPQWAKAGEVPEVATLFAPAGPPPPPVP